MAGVKTEKLQLPLPGNPSTEAPSPPTFTFGAETVITNQPIPSDDGQHSADAINFVMAAASHHAHAKRASGTPATMPLAPTKHLSL